MKNLVSENVFLLHTFTIQMDSARVVACANVKYWMGTTTNRRTTNLFHFEMSIQAQTIMHAKYEKCSHSCSRQRQSEKINCKCERAQMIIASLCIFFYVDILNPLSHGKAIVLWCASRAMCFVDPFLFLSLSQNSISFDSYDLMMSEKPEIRQNKVVEKHITDCVMWQIEMCPFRSPFLRAYKFRKCVSVFYV